MSDTPLSTIPAERSEATGVARPIFSSAENAPLPSGGMSETYFPILAIGEPP